MVILMFSCLSEGCITGFRFGNHPCQGTIGSKILITQGFQLDMSSVKKIIHLNRLFTTVINDCYNPCRKREMYNSKILKLGNVEWPRQLCEESVS